MWSTKARALLVLGGCIGLGLSACQSPGKSASAPDIVNARTPTEQYVARAVETPETMAFSVHAHGLSDRQEAALARFAQAWRASGSDAVVIESPVNSAEEGDPRAAASAAAAALARMGVPAARIQLADYDAAGRSGAPLVARFTALKAVGPDCSGHWGNLVATNSNAVSSHFGCATTANFAAQLADPRDLAGPAAMQPADGVRRATVLDKYRQGAVTSSAKDDQASGTVSTVSRQ